MKIIIMCGNDVGTAALATPLISGLYGIVSEKVDVLTSVTLAPIFQSNPAVGKILCYLPNPNKTDDYSQFDAFLHNAKMALELILCRYDALIIAKEYWDRDAIILSRLIRTNVVTAVGLDAPIAVTHPIDVPREKEHMATLLCRLADPLGFSINPGALQVFISNRERDLMLQKLNFSDDSPVFGIFLSAEKFSQRWHINNFIVLMHAISSSTKCQFMVLWSQSSSGAIYNTTDDVRVRKIMKSCRDFSPVPVYTDNLRELIVALSLCDKIITSDSGTAQLAAGVRTSTLFLSDDNASWFRGPWMSSHKIINAMGHGVNFINPHDAVDFFTTDNSSKLNEH